MTSKVIVVGLDGSETSKNALDWAVAEAKSNGSAIRLVGAYSIPSVAAATIDVSYVPIDDDGIREAVTQTLRAGADTVRRAGVEVEAVIEVGDAAGVMVEESRTAELAVVGSRGRGGFAGRLLGTVSSALPAHSHCPTAVIPARWNSGAARQPRDSMSRLIRTNSGPVEGGRGAGERDVGPDFSGQVVVGIDALGRKSPALWYAAALAARRHTPLVLVAVMTTTVIGPEWLPSTEDMQRYLGDSAEKLDACLFSLKEKYPDLDARWALFDGSPSEALVRASDTAEILVVGSRGRGGFAGLLLGSTSQAVLPHSNCPTIVVRVPKDKNNEVILTEDY